MTERKIFIAKLHGSFAFVVVDDRVDRVQAVRDFMGTKPLLWGEHADHLSFASEPVAIPLLLGRSAQPDETTIDRYLQLKGPDLRRTMVEGAAALPPNSITTISDSHLVSESIRISVVMHDFDDEESDIDEGESDDVRDEDDDETDDDGRDEEGDDLRDEEEDDFEHDEDFESDDDEEHSEDESDFDEGDEIDDDEFDEEDEIDDEMDDDDDDDDDVA